MGILGILGRPLGFVMSLIYRFVGEYFITIFLFTLLVRLLLFPISLKQQKTSMERARISPKLERLQKKYAADRQKLMEKQQEVFEREGVSMSTGCLPMLLSMIVLFGVIAAIYRPLAYLSSPSIPDEVISVAEQAIIGQGEGKVEEAQLQGYYGELRLMLNCERGTNREDIAREIDSPSKEALARAYGNEAILTDDAAYQDALNQYKTLIEGRTGEQVYGQIASMRDSFTLGEDFSLLEQPWGEGGFRSFGPLWIIPLLSGLTSLGVSWLSMHYAKKGMPANQPGTGCQTFSMMVFMPVFSTYIAFTVPGAVGIYWIFSNVLSGVQTVVLNLIYDPAKARAQAEREYQERRKKKAEDKKRLAQARQREEAEARKAEQALEKQREESREQNRRKKGSKGKGTSNGSSGSARPPREETSAPDKPPQSGENPTQTAESGSVSELNNNNEKTESKGESKDA